MGRYQQGWSLYILVSYKNEYLVIYIINLNTDNIACKQLALRQHMWTVETSMINDQRPFLEKRLSRSVTMRTSTINREMAIF